MLPTFSSLLNLGASYNARQYDQMLEQYAKTLEVGQTVNLDTPDLPATAVQFLQIRDGAIEIQKAPDTGNLVLQIHNVIISDTLTANSTFMRHIKKIEFINSELSEFDAKLPIAVAIKNPQAPEPNSTISITSNAPALTLNQSDSAFASISIIPQNMLQTIEINSNCKSIEISGKCQSISMKSNFQFCNLSVECNDVKLSATDVHSRLRILSSAITKCELNDLLNSSIEITNSKFHDIQIQGSNNTIGLLHTEAVRLFVAPHHAKTGISKLDISANKMQYVGNSNKLYRIGWVGIASEHVRLSIQFTEIGELATRNRCKLVSFILKDARLLKLSLAPHSFGMTSVLDISQGEFLDFPRRFSHSKDWKNIGRVHKLNYNNWYKSMNNLSKHFHNHNDYDSGIFYHAMSQYFRMKMASDQTSFILLLYYLCSGFGQNVLRPIWFLLVVTGSFGLFHLFIEFSSHLYCNYQKKCSYLFSLEDGVIRPSIAAVFPLLPNDSGSIFHDAITVVNTVVSGVLLFLIGFVVRNKSRLP